MSKTERASHIAIILIGIVAVFTALKLGESLFAPIALALVSGVILSPVTNQLNRLGLPPPLAAMASFAAAILAILAVIALFTPIVTRAVDAFPRVYNEVNNTLFLIQAELQGLENMEREVRKLVDPDAEEAPAEGAEDGESAAESIPTVQDVVFMAPAIAAQIVVFLGVLFFFILTRREIYHFAARKMAITSDTEEMALRFASAERSVSRYFLTISAINLGLGLTVTGAMVLIGMPSPWVWGAAAFLLNFLLYIGPAALAIALAIGGVTVFDGFNAALPPVVFLSLNFIEAQFVTPTLLGRQLSVNPLLIFLSLSFFLWLWGPLGAIVAIPLLLWGIVLTRDIRDLKAAEDERLKQAATELEPAE